MNEHSHELKFAFSDFVKLLKKHKKQLLLWMAAGALLCSLYAVTRPVQHIVKSTFRDKGKAQVGFSASLTELFFNNAGVQDSEASSTMKSRLLISQVVKELGLQGSVFKSEESYPHIKNAYENLLAEYAHWGEWKTPILPELSEELQLSRIQFDGETNAVYILKFDDRSHFEVFNDDHTESLGKGETGKPVTAPEGTFTLHTSASFIPDTEAKYVVVLFPMMEVADALGNLLQIDLDKEDKTLLKLQFRHRNRHLAAEFLNSIMKFYQKHLEGEHELTSNTQLQYLRRRQSEVGAELQTLMENHVQKVSEDMSQSGFTSLQKEMEFLGAALASNQEKIQEIDLEAKRLSHINPEECVHYDSYTSRGDPAIVNHLLAEIRMLKQEGESLEAGLQTVSNSNKKGKESIELHLAELRKTEQCNEESLKLASLISSGSKDSFTLVALKGDQYPISSWYDALKDKERKAALSPLHAKEEQAKDLQQFKVYLLDYLDHFHHLMQVRKATIEQRMRTLKTPASELEGISLATARELYIGFTRELNNISTERKQHQFVAEQLSNPTFEVCSLTALLKDPISQERIAKASQLMIQLKDENNRTQKELERLKTELDLQKQFLSSHILQIAELLLLKESMLREKVNELQALTLEQVQQQRTLLQKNLADYIESRILNLSQEKMLLLDHQAELQKRMAEIPEKWAAEQLLNQNLAMQQRFLENLSGMVESKNITKNLEMIQSSILDEAIPALNPKPPRLIFFAILGALLGFSGYSCFLFTRTMIQGVPASKDNLQLAQFHVSGSITPFQGDESAATPPLIDGDLDTLRRLIAHFEMRCETKTLAKTILLLKGKGTDFSNTLAMLLSKKGQRILKISLSFTKASESSGLLQYLEGATTEPRTEKLDGFDWIPSGGTSRYSEELLLSPRFKKLIETLQLRYDWIIAVSDSLALSAEGENLARLFDGTAIVVTDESIQDLIRFSKTLPELKQDALTFVFSQPIKD